MNWQSVRRLLKFFDKEDAEEQGGSDFIEHSVNTNVEIHNKNKTPIAASRRYNKYNKKETLHARRSKGNNKKSEWADEAYGYNSLANRYNITPEDYGSDD